METIRRVSGTHTTIRFRALALLAGTALFAPTLASASFLQLIGKTPAPFQSQPLSEPMSLMLLGCGLAATAWIARRNSPGRQGR